MRSQNPNYTYLLGDTDLASVTEQSDLGLTVTTDFKFKTHVNKIVAKANGRIAMIRRTFTYLDKEIFIPLYKTLIRPLLEYCVQVWSPNQVGLKKILERAQNRATKLVPELRNLPADERLAMLHLPTLQERRDRGDLIEMFKIIRGIVNIEANSFFTLRQNPGGYITRGHSLTLSKPRYKTIRRYTYFDVRAIN
ncbi:uncharacterized protein B0403.1-like [Antedon mediterranea]|uniref:uncharacterized protein B0403.1-like n=1 Tax=Antedon mediterranea TaxID=105859 RepID=UPI003AF4238E